MAVLIRTREMDPKTHKPRYTLVVIHPGDESFGELERTVSRRPPASAGCGRARLAVVNRSNQSGEQIGEHVLAYQFGEWLYIEYAGALTGIRFGDAALRSLVEGRLEQNPLIANQQWLSGDGFPATQRTRQWIETRADGWTIKLGDKAHDIGPWARHVERLATRIIDDDGLEDQRLAVDRLLASLYGDRFTARALLDAFEKIRKRPAAFQDLVRLLMATGLGGGTAAPPGAADVVSRLEVLGIHLFETRGGVDPSPLRTEVRGARYVHDNRCQPRGF